MPHASAVGQETVTGAVPRPGEHNESIRAESGPRREEVAE